MTHDDRIPLVATEAQAHAFNISLQILRAARRYRPHDNADSFHVLVDIADTPLWMITATGGFLALKVASRFHNDDVDDRTEDTVEAVRILKQFEASLKETLREAPQLLPPPMERTAGTVIAAAVAATDVDRAAIAFDHAESQQTWIAVEAGMVIAALIRALVDTAGKGDALLDALELQLLSQWSRWAEQTKTQPEAS